MKRLFAVIALVLLTACSAFALSDAEYLRLKKSNADFARADKRLTQIWKKVQAALDEEVFEELKENQLEWINYVRDEKAESLMQEGYSRAEAYTIATNDRADYLQGVLNSVTRRRGRK